MLPLAGALGTAGEFLAARALPWLANIGLAAAEGKRLYDAAKASKAGQTAINAAKQAPGALKTGAAKGMQYARKHPFKTAGALGLGYTAYDMLGSAGATPRQLSPQDIALLQARGKGFPILGNPNAYIQAPTPAIGGALGMPLLPAGGDGTPTASAINDAAFVQLNTAAALGNGLAQSIIDHYENIKARNLNGMTYSMAPGFYGMVGRTASALQSSAQALPRVAQNELAIQRTPIELANDRMRARAALLSAAAAQRNAEANALYRGALAQSIPYTTAADVLQATGSFAGNVNDPLSGQTVNPLDLFNTIWGTAPSSFGSPYQQ